VIAGIARPAGGVKSARTFSRRSSAASARRVARRYADRAAGDREVVGGSASAGPSQRTYRPDADTSFARTIGAMWSWVVIAVLYVLGIGFFRWLGGIGAAADAIQRWGHSAGVRRRDARSPSVF